MDRLIHPALRMGKFMHRMGPIHGAVAYRRITRNENPGRAQGIYALQVRGYKEPIWLRGGDSDGFIFGQVIIDQQYFLPEVENVRLIVDCGANIGMSALYFARRYPGAKILAIEPEPDNYAMLERNTRHLAAIHPICAAIWPRQATLTIVDPTSSRASRSVSEPEGKGPGGIRSVQLRDLVAEHGQIDILKIDIEGSEKALFEDPDSDEWLAHTRVIYAELHDWMQPGASRAFYQAITRYDFSQRQVGEIIAIEFHHAQD
jgi:FkbM family methyltransferase